MNTFITRIQKKNYFTALRSSFSLGLSKLLIFKVTDAQIKEELMSEHYLQWLHRPFQPLHSQAVFYPVHVMHTLF